MHSAYDKVNYIFEALEDCAQRKMTGTLEFASSSGHQWRFYYRLGRITWATGGSHPYRRLRRQILTNAPQIPFEKIPIKSTSPLSHWDFQLLVNCFKKGLIEPKQLELIADSVVQELLFDVIQRGNTEKLSHTTGSQISLDLPITFTSTKAFIRRADSEWHSWYSVGLESFYPDLAPVIRKHDELQKLVSSGVYKNLETYINGKNSLRDLGVQMKQETVKITATLRSHILKGIIELTSIPDLSAAPTNPNPTQVQTQVQNQVQTQVQNQVQTQIQTQVQTQIQPTPIQKPPAKVTPPSRTSSRLIACIDDSPQICQMMEQIIVSNGMRFVKVQDAIQALPLLIQNKPDLIFLDLIMPVVNGYEICSQIRRISSFAKVPIIIITSSDGLFDRVRAKAVGSTDFMTKPIVAEKVLAAINKYVPNESVSNQISRPSQARVVV